MEVTYGQRALGTNCKENERSRMGQGKNLSKEGFKGVQLKCKVSLVPPEALECVYDQKVVPVGSKEAGELQYPLIFSLSWHFRKGNNHWPRAVLLGRMASPVMC